MEFNYFYIISSENNFQFYRYISVAYSFTIRYASRTVTVTYSCNMFRRLKGHCNDCCLK